MSVTERNRKEIMPNLIDRLIKKGSEVSKETTYQTRRVTTRSPRVD